MNRAVMRAPTAPGVLILGATLAFGAGDPPRNETLGDSPFPMAHRNNYSQASSDQRGVEPGDLVEAELAAAPNDALVFLPLISEKYPDGRRVVWGGSGTHVFKALPSPNGIDLVATYTVDASVLDDHNYASILLPGNSWITADGERLLRFADADPNDPTSAIVLEEAFFWPAEIGPDNQPTIALTYDGWIVFAANHAGRVGVLRPDFTGYQSIPIPTSASEEVENALAIDESGGIFLTTTEQVMRVVWDGASLSLDWAIDVGWVRGSGTTPTLLGSDDDPDRLLVVVDRATPNRAFFLWRDAIPADWTPLPGEHPRVAAIVPLPFATPEISSWSVEDSPAARGYDVVINQFNGPNVPCHPIGGLQKLRWDTASRSASVVWSNDTVNINGVPTFAAGSNLVYGIGRSACTYTLYGFDWDTGVIAVTAPLGGDNSFNDPGASMAIGADRRMYYGSSDGIVQIRPVAVGPPSAGDGVVGNGIALTRLGGDLLQIDWDTTTCADGDARLFFGTLGDWSGYAGDVGLGCSLGQGGTATFEFSGQDVWFNLVWTSASDTAGHPGYSSDGPRSWTAAGYCGVTTDDHSDDTCD